MTERVHPDLENGFVHRSDGSILPIVAMIGRDRQKTDKPGEAVIVVAGTESAGFIVVKMRRGGRDRVNGRPELYN